MKRVTIFLYGVVVYAIFFATFLYLFAFIAGVFVPKHVDSGAAMGPAWLSILINTGLIALFGIQHAIMARPAFKRRWTQIIHPAAERSTFVLLASAILMLMFWMWQPIPTVVWDIQQPAIRAALYGVFVAGMLIVLASSFLIDHFDLFGLRQVFLHLRGLPYTQRRFVERGFYRVIRHPLMLGFFIAFWAAPTMTVGHLVFSLAFTAYIMIGVAMEERDLIALHGETYMTYRQRTGRLFPRLFATTSPSAVEVT